MCISLENLPMVVIVFVPGEVVMVEGEVVNGQG